MRTPDDSTRQDYIGNSAEHADAAVVFPQLETGPAGAREGQGVHAGAKIGRNGVDNGRIPRANLLNRFCDVSAEGVYSRAIDDSHRRFFMMLGTLVRGRVCVGGGVINAAKVARSPDLVGEPG